MITKADSFHYTRDNISYIYKATLLFAYLMIFAFDGKNVVKFIVPEAFANETESASIDGGQLYNQYCAVCHKSGLNAAPKIGSKALWANRVKQGREAVYANAINGLRGMPARGGYSQLTDEEVKVATDYMVGRSGGWGE